MADKKPRIFEQFKENILGQIISTVGALIIPAIVIAFGWVKDVPTYQLLTYAAVAFAATLACIVLYQFITFRPLAKIIFEPSRHLICHPGGGVEANVSIRAKRPTKVTDVQIRSLEPLSGGHSSAWSRQFTNDSLMPYDATFPVPLDDGQEVKIGVVHAEKSENLFHFRLAKNPSGDFYLPACPYRLTIVATTEGGKGDKRSFLVSQDGSGNLTFDATK